MGTSSARNQGRPERAPTARGRLIADKTARWAVTAGGLAIIASILGILVFILVEVAPLAGGAEVERQREWSWDEPLPGAFLVDEHRSSVAFLRDDAHLTVVSTDDGRIIEEIPLLDLEHDGDLLPLQSAKGVPGRQILYATTADQRVLAVRVDWTVTFDGARRVVKADPDRAIVFDFGVDQSKIDLAAVRIDPDGEAVAAATTEDGRLVWVRRLVEEALFSGETTESWIRNGRPLTRAIKAIAIDEQLENIYGASMDGALGWWRVRNDQAEDPQWVRSGDPITRLSMLIGDRSLVVGRFSGALEVWFPVRRDDEPERLTRIRQFPALAGPIREIVPSMRNKGFVAATEEGNIGLYYSTSGRLLWAGESDLPASKMFMTPKANAVFVSDGSRMIEFAIDNPHPEVSLKALFGKVWYESYPEPAHVWQSSGGTDDFEPKLSMVPLMIGTLKGTVYSLLLAIPLGVFGAMYTSQFLHPSYKRIVKPTVEVMAALPSVVLGFLAGLWLAPRIEQILPGLILMFLLVPISAVAVGFAWRSLPMSFRGRFLPGAETVLYIAAVSLALWCAIRLNTPFEMLLFGGNAQEWLLEATGLQYDQRNAIVVGLAMGFAVIPIIFSIAEDAFSNVPNNLISGSLALGANRWQTVTRVVLPSASPGIFSAIVIGFGRAVGETMIVLMATGNTPILDWSPFNGFRTLSANIAVEIPEAPLGGTLYRALFLAAVMLFVFTFVINTVAELVRQRLRRRYAEM